MTYFPDLSLYEYGKRGRPDDQGVLNIGWLAAERTYPTGEEVDAELMRALVLCARRVERVYRGCHQCELCPRPETLGLTKVSWGGDEVLVGNGEIRASDAEGHRYAAPTLILHYVAGHRYAPPAAFRTAVLRRAHSICTLDVDEARRIEALSPEEGYRLCLVHLAAIVAAQPAVSWLPGALAALEPLQTLLSPGGVPPDRRRPEVKAAHAVVFDHGRQGSEEIETIVNAAFAYFGIRVGWYAGEPHPHLIELVERARELGAPEDLSRSSA